MDIIHVTAELAPIAKVGGLADVLQGLCRALLSKKHSVKIILPKYDTLDLNWVENLTILENNFTVTFNGWNYINTLWQGLVDGIPVIFIESHNLKEYFNRQTIYGCSDDVERFAYFCVAAIELIKKLPSDVIHIHDWHTAMIAGLIKERHPEISSKIVLTIHNLAYQGLCRGEDLEKVGWKNQQLKESGVYSLLKGGIIFADHVTTVSPHYAKEILTSELGGNLQPTLQHYQGKFSGVINGIDYGYWNPETDPFLPFHYSVHTLENKGKVKKELKRRLSLSDEDSPIVGVVTRLVHQKGPELIKASILRTLEWGGQFVLLGSVADEKSHEQFYNLKRKLAGSPHIHIELSYHEELSHLLYAGSDLFLIPSIFEPCGLTQQIAMRYGTVPLARETGGLVDTVFEGTNGFMFGPPTAEAIHTALDRAFETWYQKPQRWKKLVETGMKGNYSWDKPADAYLQIYERMKGEG